MEKDKHPLATLSLTSIVRGFSNHPDGKSCIDQLQRSIEKLCKDEGAEEAKPKVKTKNKPKAKPKSKKRVRKDEEGAEEAAPKAKRKRKA